MVAMNIRGLDRKVHQVLKERAAQQGVSMEEMVRRILTRSVMDDEPENLAALFLETFGSHHGVDLDIPDRQEKPRELAFK